MNRQGKNKSVKSRGFSLVELMVVVAIIGTLASIALPKFQGFQAKAKQAEVKTNLSGIYTYQLSYNGENGSYFNNAYFTASRQSNMFGSNRKYTYAITGATANTFGARGSTTAGTLGKCQTGQDAWTINEDRVLSNTSNGLAGCGL